MKNNSKTASAHIGEISGQSKRFGKASAKANA